MANPDTEAFDLFLRAWQHGAAIETLPASCRPAPRAKGYAVQALLAPRMGDPRTTLARFTA